LLLRIGTVYATGVPREALLHHTVEDCARSDEGLVHGDKVGWWVYLLDRVDVFT
jgi:hypothetical protein